MNGDRSATTASTVQNPRVVVAETGEAGRYLSALLSRTGWWVSSAPTNASALTLASSTDAHLVLLDADDLDEAATKRYVANRAGGALVLFGREASSQLAVRVGAASVVPRPFEAIDAVERVVRALDHIARRDHGARRGGVRDVM